MEKQLAKPMGTDQQLRQYLPKEELTRKITSSNLTSLEKEIGLASIEKWVKDYSVQELIVLMTGLIQRTHANCGQKDDEGMLDMTIDELITDLQKYNGNISFQEIQIAFNNGYKGIYGEWFGLNNKTYFTWINAYTWSVQRKNAKALLKPEEKKKDLTDDEKDKKIADICLQLFEEFKKTGNVLDIGNINYKFLRSIGIINFTEERRNGFKNTAQAYLKAAAQEAKISAKGMYAIKDALKQISTVQDINSNEVISEAKRIAINTYFKELVEMGEELKDQISNNQNQTNNEKQKEVS